MYLGGSPFDLPGLFTILPYGELAEGLWLPEGGIYSLVAATEKLARELGVEIHTGMRVRRILHRNGKVVGILLEEGAEIGSSVVASNVDVPSTLSDLAGQPVPMLRMSPSVMTFYWVVEGRCPGLGHHTIYLPHDYAAAFRELNHGRAIPSDPAFYVAAPGVSDPTLAQDVRSGVFVLVPTPLLGRLAGVDWAAETCRVRETVLQGLQRSGAGLTSARILMERVWTPWEWKQRFGLYDGSAFGAAHTLSQMGPFRPPNYSQRLQGLYFVGASTTPGTGMPMVVLSGRLVSERIQQRVC
jgi:phytoene desaturase